MSVLEELARSRVKAKAAANKLEVAVLKKLIESLTAALAVQEKRAREKAARDRQNNINRINQLLAENGLSVADLKEAPPRRRRRRRTKQRRGAKRGKVAPKYRLVVDGVEHLWSGRGRAPRVFADYFAQGNSRESVEIPRES